MWSHRWFFYNFHRNCAIYAHEMLFRFICPEGRTRNTRDFESILQFCTFVNRIFIYMFKSLENILERMKFRCYIYIYMQQMLTAKWGYLDEFQLLQKPYVMNDYNSRCHTSLDDNITYQFYCIFRNILILYHFKIKCNISCQQEHKFI